MLCTDLFLTLRTILVHIMFSPCSAKRRASDKDLPVHTTIAENLKSLDFIICKLANFSNEIIDYGSLCIDYESLLKTVGQLLLIRSIYRIRFELKAHKGSGCPQNSKAERESEF